MLLSEVPETSFLNSNHCYPHKTLLTWLVPKGWAIPLILSTKSVDWQPHTQWLTTLPPPSGPLQENSKHWKSPFGLVGPNQMALSQSLTFSHLGTNAFTKSLFTHPNLPHTSTEASCFLCFSQASLLLFYSRLYIQLFIPKSLLFKSTDMPLTPEWSKFPVIPFDPPDPFSPRLSLSTDGTAQDLTAALNRAPFCTSSGKYPQTKHPVPSCLLVTLIKEETRGVVSRDTGVQQLHSEANPTAQSGCHFFLWISLKI